jgi:NADH:ubiquinone oxidoreductase subunit 5 (subunit L)/multisubunit Na+/H+ antiporter MnhA subunit
MFFVISILVVLNVLFLGWGVLFGGVIIKRRSDCGIYESYYDVFSDWLLFLVVLFFSTFGFDNVRLSDLGMERLRWKDDDYCMEDGYVGCYEVEMYVWYVVMKVYLDVIWWGEYMREYLLCWLLLMGMLEAIWLGRVNYLGFSCVDCYEVEMYNLRVNGLGLFMVMVVIMVSSCVILCSMDYLGMEDSYLLLLYLSLFQLFMVLFVLGDDYVVIYLGWDWLGLVSYLLVNFWSGKTRSGIKAVVFNGLGDICFLFSLSLLYSYVGFMNYSPFLPYVILFIMVVFLGMEGWVVMLCLSLMIIFFSKSAQLPLSSWLLNAMSAPTPVSSSLHSSTMVIAGVYLGLIMQPVLMMMVDSFSLVVLMLWFILVNSLLWSVIKAISLSDIKSMIAFSTISQISYMFLGIYGFGVICIVVFHIVIHALFKSLLFLLCGSLIHVECNFQCIYRLRINHCFINVSFILGGSVLIISLSKEGIIYCCYCIISSAFVSIIVVLGGIFTALYTIKIYSYVIFIPLRFIYYDVFIYGRFNDCGVFNGLVNYGVVNYSGVNNTHSYIVGSNVVCNHHYYYYPLYFLESRNQMSFILPWLTISSIIVDQSLEYIFDISCSLINDSMDCCSLLSIDCILELGLLLFVFMNSIVLCGLLLFSGLLLSCFLVQIDWVCYLWVDYLGCYNYWSSFNDYLSCYYLSSFPYQLFTMFLFVNRSSFLVIPFQYFYVFYCCFFFKGPIYLIEVYTGLNSYSLYHIYYYSSLLIVILGSFWLLFMVVLF